MVLGDASQGLVTNAELVWAWLEENGWLALAAVCLFLILYWKIKQAFKHVQAIASEHKDAAKAAEYEAEMRRIREKQQMELEEARSIWLAKQLEKEEQQRKARIEELDEKAQRLGIRLKGQGHKLGHGDKKSEEGNDGSRLSQERGRMGARTGETSSLSRSSTQPAEQRRRPPAGGALGGFGGLPTYRPAARRRPGGGG